MVAMLPLPLALRDLLLAAGLGFLLSFFYRALRLVLGGARWACFVCDITAFAAGALLYRSAAAGAFAAGVMRWYTLMALLAAYALTQQMFSSFFLYAEKKIHQALQWPFVQMRKNVFFPLQHCFVRHLEQVIVRRRAKKEKRNVTKAKTQIKDLQKTQKVLYNSN